MKNNKYHVGTVPKSIRITVETVQNRYSLTHIYITAHFPVLVRGLK